MKRLVPLALAVTVVAAGCGGSSNGASSSGQTSNRRPTATTTESSAASPLSWGRCADEMAASAGLRCATLVVPVDPDTPKSGTVRIALARRAASGSRTQRIGSLVMNPGGPGGSGIEFLAGIASQMPEQLQQRFDLVSFDPRGVGASSPVRCLTDAEKRRQFTGDLSPDTPQEVQRALDDQREFRSGCTRRSPQLLRHMSTADVANDLDRIRAALGDDRLTFLGLSYGTSIAATYATMFPERVRALILDGSISPNASDATAAAAQLRGFERTLERFVAACNTSKQCPLAPNASAAIAAARASVAANPVVVTSEGGPRTLGPDQFDLGLATALYATATWGVAANAVRTVRDAGARVLLTLGDQQTGRKADGTFDNSADAQTMVSCADSPERPSAAEATAAAQRMAAATPGFGTSLGWSLLSCVDWPRPTNPNPVPRAPDAPKLLVIGTLGDPATPYEWAQQMTEALGNATLLTYEGDGHTAFFKGSDCIDAATAAYLIDLRVPAAGTRCTAVPDAATFGGLQQELADQLQKAGVPEQVANCVVDNLVEQLGEGRLDQLVLDENIDELSKYITAATLDCATGG
ncbi:MAG: alpha/beta hydrolase [Actinomycetes bacterium]